MQRKAVILKLLLPRTEENSSLSKPQDVGWQISIQKSSFILNKCLKPDTRTKTLTKLGHKSQPDQHGSHDM